MKAFLIAFVVLAQGPWITGNRVSVPLGAPNKSPGIWVSATTPVAWPNVPLPPNQWHTIDLSDGPQWNGWTWQLPESTVAVELAGILIVTNATNDSPSPVKCEVRATFRAPGDTLHENGYQMQLGVSPNDPGRGNAVTTVQVINRRFEFFWRHTPECGVWPSGAGMNLMIQKVIWNAP